MPKRAATRRSSSSGQQRSARGKGPPPLDTPFEIASNLSHIRPMLDRFLGSAPDTAGYRTMGGDFGKAIIQGVNEAIRDDRVFDLNWPPGLYIPTGANPADYWGTASPPAANRYALSWTNGIGFATASVADGSLHAVASSPTVQGAINGTAEAGLGVIYTPKHTRVRLRIEPDLNFTGLFQWDVLADPVVWIRTRVVGSVLVGAYESNPATGGWERILNFTWRRHVLFDDSHVGSGSFAVTSAPLKTTGASAGMAFYADAGRSYLLAVVAQVGLKVETSNSQGRPVSVTNGKFNTFGSVTGVVREIWIDQQVLIN